MAHRKYSDRLKKAIKTESGFLVLHETKGWRHVTAKRVDAEVATNALRNSKPPAAPAPPRGGMSLVKVGMGEPHKHVKLMRRKKLIGGKKVVGINAIEVEVPNPIYSYIPHGRYPTHSYV
jgi:hypothetical protein